MDRIRIVGGQRLHGTIPISGAKNATLPLMIASLLTDQTLILDNVPRLADVVQLQRILGNHGVDIMMSGKRPGDDEYKGQTMHLSAARIVDTTAPYELVSKMRASFWVVAPLVARMGEARVSMPGGCAIGTRPVDLLLMALERLGVAIEIDGGYVVARASRGLKGGDIAFPSVTVSGTHVALMAATLADGTTVIENAAREPEIVDLCTMLQQMGAKIDGVGSSTLMVHGVPSLQPTEHRVIGDRIVGATWAFAAAMTRGEVTVRGVDPHHLDLVLDKLRSAGAKTTIGAEEFTVRMDGRPRAVDFVTLPYPGFATDLQPMAIALSAVSDGTSMITENVFEARFRFVDEMMRLGADARTDGHHAVVRGVERLSSAPVWASDIRAGAGLVLAGLCADGLTEVWDVEHIDRGYPRFVENLCALGAEVARVRSEPQR
jgi:UDP-N-acetylglucosamine 1-carboxyvinyltransferase